MNIFEFCERFNISQAKARKMDKAGVLRLDEAAGKQFAQIRWHLSRGQPLTAAMLVELIESPGAIADLGRYADKAREEIAKLGKIEPAPRPVVACITDAAKNDPDSVDLLTTWLRETIPHKPVGHSYLAVRLLAGLAPNIRKFDIPRIPRAFLNCRLRPEFAGWWRTKNCNGRNVTIYQQPPKIMLDL